jgi:glycosyltransferase involved in cell wall biosynthesis
MRHPPDVSIVIPCYRSEPSLPLLVQRIHQTMSAAELSFELVFVEDGSPDGTWKVIQGLARQYPFIRGFRLMRNYGQHNALLCGIRAARGGIIVTLDDDLQNPPEEIPRLLAKLNEGYDVVYGTPQKEAHGLLRDVASQLTKLVLQKSMGAATARNISAYRVFRTRLRDAFAEYRGSFVSIDVLLTWGGARFTAIPVKNDPRTIGVSNYTLYKLISHAVNMMTGFGTAPLQLASLAGLPVHAGRWGHVSVRYRQLFAARLARSRVPIPGLRDRHIFRCTAFRLGNHGGISCPDPCPHYGSTQFRRRFLDR